MSRTGSDTGLVTAIVGFFVLTQIPLGGIGAGLYAIGLAWLHPRWAPFLLVTIAAVQDAPGLNNDWAYVSFAGVSAALFAFLVGRKMRDSQEASETSRWLGVLGGSAVGVVTYGVLISLAHTAFQGRTQSAERPFMVLAVLMVVMVLGALGSARTILSDPRGLRRLTFVIGCCLVNAFLVAAVQAVVGPGFGHSPEGLTLVLASEQLAEASVLGVPRITSTFVSPNAFPLITGLLLLVALAARPASAVSGRFAGLFVGLGVVASILSLSKSMLAFFIVAGLVVCWAARRLGIAVVTLGAAVVWLVQTIDPATADLAFRISLTEESYRIRAWRAVLREFHMNDWIVGTGLSHWQTFFQERIGVDLQDPHSVLFSVPGTFGVFGLLFYVILAAGLIVAFQRTGHRGVRAAIIALGAILLGRDLAAIPYVFGNTPISFLLWLIVGLIVARAHAQVTQIDHPLRHTPPRAAHA